MNIKEINIKNFLTLESAKLNLAERGLLLIQGDNQDDSSASSNGAGKSSVADAICWGLYGVTARGVTADGVVNNKAKKDCMVDITVSDGVSEYQITRYRKDSTNKNQTLVVQRSHPGASAVTLTKGTEKETQEVIDKLIGCSLEVFQAAVYAGQEKMPDLPAMTDKQLKLMIEEAAGVEILSKAHQKARDLFNSVGTQMTSLKAKLEVLRRQETLIGEDVAENIVQFKEYEGQRKVNAKAELEKIAPIQAQIAGYQRVIDENVMDGVKEEAEAVAKKLADQKTEQDAYNELMKKAHDGSNVAIRARSKAETLKATLDKAKKDLQEIDDHVGKPCGECGKEYHEEDLAAAKKVKEANIKAAQEALQPALLALKTALNDAKALEEAATAFKEGMTDVSFMAARSIELQKRLSNGSGAERMIKQLQENVEKVKSAAKLWLTNDNPYTKHKEIIAARAKSNADDIAVIEGGIAKLQEEHDLLEGAVKVFGPAGVRAHVLDTVTPFLNDRTANYLSAMSDGNIHAVWNTLTKNAKGELKEKFNIEVTNDKGGESFAGISGGEKRKVRLATALALQDMVASRASKPINIFVADEIDQALDEPGLERLMTILNEKAKDRGTVLVVSHNALTDWIDEVITVTKKGRGGSTVSGAIGV